LMIETVYSPIICTLASSLSVLKGWGSARVHLNLSGVR
jgi:hypothetical protein